MVEVIIEEKGTDEGRMVALERGLREFRRRVIREGIFQDLRMRRYAMTEKQRRKYKKVERDKERKRRRERRKAQIAEAKLGRNPIF